MVQLQLAFVWIKANWSGVLISLGALVAFLETVVRLTPTKTDDGAVLRIGKVIDWLFELAHIPNVSKVQTFGSDEKDVKP